MKFEEHVKQRIKLGAKEYGDHAWKKLTPNQLIQMIQEELIDAVNYINWLKEKGIDVSNYNNILRVMYITLEEKRK